MNGQFIGKRTALLCVCAALVIVAIAQNSASASSKLLYGPAGIRWNTIYAAAVSQATERNTLVLADFYVDNSPACRLQESNIFSVPGVQNAVNKFVAVKIDAATPYGAPLAARYNVGSFPTILLIAPDGTLIQELPGFQPAQQVADFINNVAQTRRALHVLREEHRQNPENTDVELNLATADASLLRVNDALALASKLEAAKMSGKLGSLYLAVGNGCFVLNRLPDAIAAYNKAIADSKNSDVLASAHNGLARCIAQNKAASRS